MKYINAKDILPVELLKELQQYAQGNLMYIPRTESLESDQRQLARDRLQERNQRIRQRRQEGASIEELMEEFYLSYDSIKKIIYSKE